MYIDFDISRLKCFCCHYPSCKTQKMDGSDCAYWAYRDEVQHLKGLSDNNNLHLNTTKTKEMVIDFRRTKWSEYSTLYIDGEEVERVESFKFLRIHILANLTVSTNISHQVE